MSALVERFRPLFYPRGIVIPGVSTHPGKFGFAALHNLLCHGYAGELFPVNRDGATVLDRATYRDIADIPNGRADLAFVCTPASANIEVLRACARSGVRAAFVVSGGYGEAGEDGAVAERELVGAARALDMVLAGPNGQGLISTSVQMCAQIVPPYPPPGRISAVSQSGNILSSFMNYGQLTGVGFSKGISAGNSAALGLADYIEYFAEDPDSAVALAYLEGVRDGRDFVRRAAHCTRRKPLVLLKGGVTSRGQRAASSHTGSLASDDRIFSGICRQTGIRRTETVEEAYEVAATFATQPLPRGKRVVVLTAAGGWGVLCADACVRAGLELIALPDDLRARIDRVLPARWSRNNPVDMAGGETRETIPELLDGIVGHDAVDAVIYLGLGIQAAQAHVMKSSPFYPGHGLERIAEFHERQDRRYAEAAAAASARYDKPVLCATELVYTDRAYGNSAPVAVAASGRICYPSAHRAVNALAHLCAYAAYRQSAESPP
ncbi:MAG TPA: CoA-binding protein [Candidatus Binatia bacterium]|nr:CoA-binding protein [Candidatus Binatia bacterium]